MKLSKKEFLTDSEHTGRFIVKDLITGKEYWVEPIDNTNKKSDWGDVNTSTKEVEGAYGQKYKGSVHDKDSLTTEKKWFHERSCDIRRH